MGRRTAPSHPRQRSTRKSPHPDRMPALDSLLVSLSALHPRRIDLSLDRIERLLTRLGRPQDRLPPVIHVAGTNGKGSTVAFLRACLEADGRTVHAYTSPHLVRFNERIRLGRPGGGRLADDATLIEAIRHVTAANGGEPITFFEVTTAVAFHLYAAHRSEERRVGEERRYGRRPRECKTKRGQVRGGMSGEEV